MLSFDITTDSNTRTTFYQRTISPLKKIDYIAIGSLIGSAALISLVALRTFDFFILPLVAALCSLSVIGSCHLIKYRSERHFHREILEKLSAIQTITTNGRSDDPQIEASAINRIVNQLREDPCFKNWQETFKELCSLAENLLVDWETNIHRFQVCVENLQDRLKI